MHKRFDLRSNDAKINVLSHLTFKSICLINEYINKIIDKIIESVDYFELKNNIKNKTTHKIMLVPNEKFCVTYENTNFTTEIYYNSCVKIFNTKTIIIQIYYYSRGCNTLLEQAITLDEFLEFDDTKFNDHWGYLDYISANIIKFLYDNLKETGEYLYA